MPCRVPANSCIVFAFGVSLNKQDHIYCDDVRFFGGTLLCLPNQRWTEKINKLPGRSSCVRGSVFSFILPNNANEVRERRVIATAAGIIDVIACPQTLPFRKDNLQPSSLDLVSHPAFE